MIDYRTSPTYKALVWNKLTPAAGTRLGQDRKAADGVTHVAPQVTGGEELRRKLKLVWVHPTLK